MEFFGNVVINVGPEVAVVLFSSELVDNLLSDVFIVDGGNVLIVDGWEVPIVDGWDVLIVDGGGEDVVVRGVVVGNAGFSDDDICKLQIQ